MNRPEDCPRFESCSAPICPIVNSGIWYPDEEYCVLQEFSGLSWVRNQRKIARTCREPGFCFTQRMLQHNCIIGRAISGIDPDREISMLESDEKKWLRDHPAKREITDSEKEALRNRLFKIKQRLTPVK